MENKDLVKRRLAAAENMAVRQRNYRRARDRALARLANDYKEIYLDYLAEEKAKDEQEGKRWHNLANSDVDIWTNVSRIATGQTAGDTATNSANEGDNL